LVAVDSPEVVSVAVVVVPGKESVEKQALAPGLYQHFKGGLYDVLDTVVHSETLETYVLYRPQGSCICWIRPYAMFCEELLHEGRKVRRFTKLED
jgi:hypothetical protein